MVQLNRDIVVSEVRGLLGRDTVRHHGVTLPIASLRACGPHFNDDAYFLSSAEREARKLVDRLGLNENSRVLDVGCGVGRLPIGILKTVGAVRRYCGVDVKLKSIRWCKRHIQSSNPSFEFMHLDVKNDRYNPSGGSLSSDFHFPLASGSFDIINLYSVFSHMVTADIEIYLREFSRVLAEDGHIYLTAFVEDGVPDISVNPDSYQAEWSGPLHCVRYSRTRFDSLLEQSGFQIDRFDHADEDAGQSSVYISRRTAAPQPTASPGDLV